MSGRIVVLGAGGRMVHAAAEAFRDVGWQVVRLVRPGAGERAPRGTEVVESPERAAAVEAAQGAGIVLHALNVPYPQWRTIALNHAYATIEVAATSGATLLFPGNVYNYGAGMPDVLDEHTPMRPTTRKGAVRETIELRMREATDRGMRAIVLRAGDYFGAGRGSWFDLVMTKDLRRDRIVYPGPLDVMHAWAYLPDLAATMVRLAERRAAFDAYETFGFPGHAVTGRQMIDTIAAATGRNLQVRSMRWWVVKRAGGMLG